MILKINEEQQGLKLIQVNDGFVVVDLNTDKVTTNYFVYAFDSHEGRLTTLGVVLALEFGGVKIKPISENVPYIRFSKEEVYKILFATPNLNLEGVSVIEYSFNEWHYKKGLKELKEDADAKFKQKYESDGRDLISHRLGYVFGVKDCEKRLVPIIKQAQQNLFTEEQVREAFITGALTNLFNTWGISKEDYALEHANKHIQSLKQPKVEITFQDGEPIKCVLI